MARRVRVIALGGTIAMEASSGALLPGLGAGDLAALVGTRDAGLEIDWCDRARIASANIGFADLAGLAAEIDDLHAQGYHGVVVSQGTDTLEETAFALELLVQAPIDIALTGAMRGAGQPGADGPANLLAALCFLEASAGGGEVVVVMDDCVHAARHAEKRHTSSLAAFSSGEAGLRGRIHEGRFRALASAPTRLPKVRDADTGRIPQVELITVSLGQSARLFRDAGPDAADGWVIAAMGAGHVPEHLVPELERLARDCPVILCSRTGAGRVCTQTYGYAGGEIDLLRRGLLPAGALPPLKARIALTLLLMDGAGDCRARFADIVAAI
ncbi:asparaginase [Sandaracinobacter neustonicus]|uniref:Asparaginase n=1 Tax=Sandaracinobacter neustonicus TaxID=1715348 RepID=A0A501XKA4_9SPHN|nr:asparaginase [Sandaracinobacter neustonicus]TPE60986.1 asparaginase [Sandaracinobacter neustonicus]